MTDWARTKALLAKLQGAAGRGLERDAERILDEKIGALWAELMALPPEERHARVARLQRDMHDCGITAKQAEAALRTLVSQ